MGNKPTTRDLRLHAVRTPRMPPKREALEFMIFHGIAEVAVEHGEDAYRVRVFYYTGEEDRDG